MSEELLQHAAAQGLLRAPVGAGLPPAIGTPDPRAAAQPAAPRAALSHDVPPEAPGSTVPATPSAPGGEAASPAWYESLPDEQLRRWAQAKGWKDALSAVESNYNLERMMGAERAGRMVAVPGENASEEEVRNFRARIGVPDNAEGYALAVPEGAPDDFARTAAGWMHEAGVPARSAGVLAQRWNEHLAQSRAQEQARVRAQSENELAQLKGEWGGQFDANADRARRAALHFLPAPDAQARTALMGKMEQSLGTATFLRFMAKVGLGLSEHRLISSGDAGLLGHYSPGEARERIAQLRADRAWTASYVAGDAAKAAEMNRLHRMAFPGGGQ